MSDQLAPFDSARLKTARAQHHIDCLKQAVGDFLDAKPVAIIIEANPAYRKAGAHVWTARIRQPVPTIFSSMIGDAIHNLRTALDLLASDLVRLNGENTKNVYFPFSHDASELNNQIRAKNFDRAGHLAVKILRAIRPYTGGNATLRGLHDLDIRDKHRALIPAIHAIKIPGFRLFYNGRTNSVPDWDTTITHDGQTVLVMPVVDNRPAGTEIEICLQLVLPADGPFPGMEVVPTLECLSQEVAATIDAFETLYPATAWPPTSHPPLGTAGSRTLLIGDPRRPPQPW